MRLLTRGQSFELEINPLRKVQTPIWTLRWRGRFNLGRLCPALLHNQSNRLRFQNRWGGIVADHRLLQLRIDFIRNGHNVQQYLTEIHAVQISLQSSEDAHLQDAGFFDNHGNGVALLTPHLPMVASSHGNWGWQSRIQAQAKDEVSKKLPSAWRWTAKLLVRAPVVAP